jgi:hypothetical protein
MSEPTSRVSHLLMVLTALVGLVGGALYAGVQYYEFNKARAEAEKGHGKNEPPRLKGDGPREPARPIDYAGTAWQGTLSEPTDTLYCRLNIDTTTGEKFVGRWAHLGVGEIKGDKITFAYTANDIIQNGGGQPSKFAGTIGGREASGSIEHVKGGPYKGRFDLTRK